MPFNIMPSYIEMAQVDDDDEAKKPFIGNDDETDSKTEAPLKKVPKVSSQVKVLITVFVGVAALAGVAVMLVKQQNKSFLIRPDSLPFSDEKRKFTIADSNSGTYGYSTYSAHWITDNSYVHTTSNGFVLTNVDTKKEKVLMTNSEILKYGGYMQKLSADGKWLLFANNVSPLYRRSFYAEYYVKNIATGQIWRLQHPYNNAERMRHCAWSTTGHALVFVHRENIYYIPDVSNLSIYYEFTKDGVPKKIFNGVPDWVYEEEIINSNHAVHFSPDGKYLTYVRFDASKVPFYRFPKYGPASNQYPNIEKIPYPKAGFPNPTIKITVIDIKKATTGQPGSRLELIPPREIRKSDYYYAAITINEKNKVFVQWLNRAQNHTVCMLYDATGVSSAQKVEYHSTPHGWIDDDYVKPSFSSDGKYYVTMLPGEAGNGKGKFRHLAKVDIDNPKLANNYEFMTKGAFTVQDIKCWDPIAEIVYFRSTEYKLTPRFRHVYSYNLKTKKSKCVSCGMVKDLDKPHEDCTFYSPSFSKSCSWMVLNCLGPIVPQSHMVNLKNMKRRYPLNTNNYTRKALKLKDVPVNVHYTVKSDGFDITVRETRPKYFDKYKRHAVLFSVYNGPNYQKVTDQFPNDIFDWNFVGKDIIVVAIDARGSGYHGYKYLYDVYRNIGRNESRDAIAVAKHLQKQTYVDPTRIAIWGWSYGGFFSASVISSPFNVDDNNKPVFSTALSVAPVTDWRYYDTVYSERYMALPTKEDNLAGYQASSVMKRAKNFKGKNYMIIHGTGDDNVHFQNSAQLVAALINAQVKFKTMFYPDRKHGIESGYHVWYTIADFLLSCLTGKKNPVVYGDMEKDR